MYDGLASIRSGNLLYTDDIGHDACGIGGVASKDGKPSYEVIAKALLALKKCLSLKTMCNMQPSF